MHGLAGVLFEVKAGDADALLVSPAVGADLDEAVLGQRLVELADLVALGEIGIEVVFAGEDGGVVDPEVERLRGLDGEFDGLAVEHGQGSGHAQADRADVAVGLGAEDVGTAAEDLGLGEQLHVHFETDDSLVLGLCLFRRGRHHDLRL